MLNKNTHYVIVITKGGKYSARAVTIGNCNNLVGWCKDELTHSMNAADSKKQAEELADFWNDCYRKNGSYMFE